MNRKRIIISGGGTAGHLYPALVVGQKLKEKDPDISLTFVGSGRGLEKKLMKHYKANFITLKIEGIKGKGLKIFKSLFILPYAFVKSLAILLRTKPQLVIGVGGYSSGPIVLLASWMKTPTLIMEQNTCPGFTNRLLLPWVQKAAVSFESSLSYFRGKGIFTGNPVREEFYSLPPKEKNSKLTLFIFGGSQGSHFLNKGIVLSLPVLKKERGTLRIFHQTGKKDFEWVKESYMQNGFEDVIVSPFFFDMAEYFKRSDLIISRAGATTIAELIAAQKASLLIPFAKATDNHQVLNARELEKMNATEVITEEKFTPELFTGKIFRYMKDKEKINQIEKNLALLKKEKISENIADLCFELMKTKRQEKII